MEKEKLEQLILSTVIRQFTIEDIFKAFNDGKLYGNGELKNQSQDSNFVVWFENTFYK